MFYRLAYLCNVYFYFLVPCAGVNCYEIWHSELCLFLETQKRFVVKICMCIVWCYLISDGTPYAGGHFCVKVVLGKSFPAEAPKGFFLTKIFHPNVAKNGEICVNTLKKDWKSDYGVKHILLVWFFLTTVQWLYFQCTRYTTCPWYQILCL